MTARILCALALPLALAGCAGAPPSGRPDAGNTAADLAAGHAVTMVGKPYRYGGAAPSTGFDCSGLVQFSFRQAGVPIPRSTEEQRLSSRPVAAAELQPGDLVFFDHQGEKNSHVGIYTGGGMFVHAPSTGKEVRRDRLDSPYWKKHISETRRLAL
jgi:cell wall-associated NlpC family hydrolase